WALLIPLANHLPRVAAVCFESAARNCLSAAACPPLAHSAAVLAAQFGLAGPTLFLPGIIHAPASYTLPAPHAASGLRPPIPIILYQKLCCACSRAVRPVPCSVSTFDNLPPLAIVSASAP